MKKTICASLLLLASGAQSAQPIGPGILVGSKNAGLSIRASLDGHVVDMEYRFGLKNTQTISYVWQKSRGYAVLGAVQEMTESERDYIKDGEVETREAKFRSGARFATGMRSVRDGFEIFGEMGVTAISAYEGWGDVSLGLRVAVE